MHDRSVCQPGVYDRAVAAIKTAKARGFRVNINCTLFNDADAGRGRRLLRRRDASWASTGSRFRPATPMSARPTSSTSSTARQTKELFRAIFRRGEGKRNGPSTSPRLFLDFLAGNQAYHCTPWGNPTRNVFGWQRPCYLLGEGYAKTFKELMEETDWDALRHRQLREMRRLHGA